MQLVRKPISQDWQLQLQALHSTVDQTAANINRASRFQTITLQQPSSHTLPSARNTIQVLHQLPNTLLISSPMSSRRTGSALFLLAVIAMAAWSQPAAAFCVYNTGSKGSATFLAWPLSGQTFKAAVGPGKSACCNYQNPTCFAKEEGQDGDDPLGQCADVVFFVSPRSLGTNEITQKLIAKEAEELLSPLIAITGAGLSLLPGVGTAIGIGAAAAAAGLDLTAINSKTGVDFQPGDRLVHAINGGAVDFNPDTVALSANKPSNC